MEFSYLSMLTNLTKSGYFRTDTYYWDIQTAPLLILHGSFTGSIQKKYGGG